MADNSQEWRETIKLVADSYNSMDVITDIEQMAEEIEKTDEVPRSFRAHDLAELLVDIAHWRRRALNGGAR